MKPKSNSLKKFNKELYESTEYNEVNISKKTNKSNSNINKIIGLIPRINESIEFPIDIFNQISNNILTLNRRNSN